MNDTTITKTISTIHSAIIDLLAFIFVTLFVIYFTLHVGLKLDKFILPGLKIEQLYIKWDEKIVVDVDSLKITKSNTNSSFDLKSINAKKFMKRSHLFDSFFSQVTIRNIQINEVNATFSYKEREAAHIEVNGPTLDVLADVVMNDHLILLNIKHFVESSTQTTLQAKMLVDIQEDLGYGDINITLADTIPLKILLLADKEKVKLWAKGTRPITKPIGPVVRLADLGPVINPWIIDYLKGDKLTIDYITGTLFYDNPITLLDTLDIKANYSDVEYVFAPGYAPAIGHKVDLGFKDRTLYIYPRNATFYGQPGGTTWIKIDFENPANPLLSVDVETTARLTPQLITWLEGYGIGLPFYQTKGQTNVKFALSITLRDLDINANGTFTTPKSTFNFTGMDINIENVKINLDNTDVEINTLHGDLLDKAIIFDLAGEFNPVKEVGHFDVLVNKLHFGDKDGFKLDKSYGALRFSYLLQPKADRLLFPINHWLFDNKKITVQPFIAPFKFSSLSGTVPTTLVDISGHSKAYVTGSFNIKELTTDLDIDLLKLHTSSLVLDQTNAQLNVSYKDGLHLQTKIPSHWKLDRSKFILKPSKLSYIDNIVSIEDAHIAFEDIVDSHVKGSYNTHDGHGKLILKQLHAALGDKELLDIKKDIKIYIKKEDEEHFLEVPIFNLKVKSNPRRWNLGINNIHLLASYSPLLQEYNVTTGSIHLQSLSRQKKIHIYGSLTYPYKILVHNNAPIKEITFKGNYANETLNLYLNESISANLHNNRLVIKADGGTGVDLFAVLDFIHDHPSADKKQKSSDFKVDIQAKNSYLYLNKERRALADKLLLQYKDNRLNAQLLHGPNGGAFLEYYDKKFFIYGDNFNDKFMDGLAEFSDFKGGKLSFYIKGEENKIDGIVQVKDTIIKDYKSLNNIFAVLNTIPALVTFSVPHYNAKGLKLQEAYASFSIKDNIMTIPGFHVNADELSFNGRGTINIKELTQNAEVSVVTKASENLSKIPLLGYILVGKEDNTATTTLTMTGPLADPIVKNTLAKDIGVGTFNILKRTLTFPVHYIEKAQKSIKALEKRK